jgi:hypothetical protein
VVAVMLAYTDTTAAAAAGASTAARTTVHATDAQTDAFMRAIAGVRSGTEFSVNLVRRQLDAAVVPPVARAGLFNAAVELGLIEAVWAAAGARRVPVVEPSTGGSAKGARVRVYRRTAAVYRGPGG